MLKENFYFIDRILPPFLVGEFKKMRDLIDLQFEVCDLGCGDGAMIADLQRKGNLGKNINLTGVDISKANVKFCQKQFSRFNFLVADVRRLPFESATLNFVYSWMVAEHLENPEEMFEEVFRVLIPKGKFFIASIFKKPDAFYFYRRGGEFVLDTTHLHEFKSERELISLLQNSGFRVEKTFVSPRCYSFLELCFHILRRLKFFQKKINRDFFVHHKVLQILRRNLLVPAPGFFEIQAFCAKIT